MEEKTIYSEWAFDPNWEEKRDSNKQVYSEIKDKATMVSVGHGYGHTKYAVKDNPENLNTRQLALIADKGNLCFGYRTEGDLIIIHTD